MIKVKKASGDHPYWAEVLTPRECGMVACSSAQQVLDLALMFHIRIIHWDIRP